MRTTTFPSTFILTKAHVMAKIDILIYGQEGSIATRIIPTSNTPLSSLPTGSKRLVLNSF